jgi:hypothetical protein
MPIDWNKIAADAGTQTDEAFKTKISSLTSLDDEEIIALMQHTGIDKKNFALVLKEVQDATKSNNDKATAIKNINNGISLLVEIARKFI